MRLQGRGLCSHKDYISTICDRSVREGVCVPVRGATYQGLESQEIHVVIRIAVVEDGLHASVDDLLEVRPRSTHPISSRGEIVVDGKIVMLKCTKAANFGRYRWVIEIWVNHWWEWVRGAREHVVWVPDCPFECKEDFGVAEVCSRSADRVIPPIITSNDLCFC